MSVPDCSTVASAPGGFIVACGRDRVTFLGITQLGLDARGMGENPLAKRHLLPSHPHRGGRRSSLYVLRPHASERDESEGPYGSAADLFALHFPGVGFSTRCEKNVDHRPRRRVDSNIEIDAVEIDPEVIRMARDFFNVRESNNLHLHAQDGRLFLTRTQNQYDIILLDAYFTDAMPFHLTTKEFFELAQKKLTPNGIVVANLISAVTGPSGRIARAFVRTQRQIFPQAYVFAARRPDHASLDTIQNVIVVATREKQRLEIKEIVKRATAIDRGLFPDPIQDIAVAYFDKTLPEDVPVLTDDYAPTDNLLNP